MASQSRWFMLGCVCGLALLLACSPVSAARNTRELLGTRGLLGIYNNTKLAIHLKLQFNNQSGISYIVLDLPLKLKNTAKASSAWPTFPYYSDALSTGPRDWATLAVYYTNGTAFQKWTIDRVLATGAYLNNDNLVAPPKLDKQGRNKGIVLSTSGVGFHTTTYPTSWNLKVVKNKFILTGKGIGTSAPAVQIAATAIYS